MRVTSLVLEEFWLSREERIDMKQELNRPPSGTTEFENLCLELLIDFALDETYKKVNLPFRYVNLYFRKHVIRSYLVY